MYDFCFLRKQRKGFQKRWANLDLYDETSTYDLNFFINAIEGAQKALGLSDDQAVIIEERS
ncbi:MAG: hypothetical protein V8S82_05780 [Eubacteriales bacterium]